jgi:hypothetical protein
MVLHKATAIETVMTRIVTVIAENRTDPIIPTTTIGTVEGMGGATSKAVTTITTIAPKTMAMEVEMEMEEASPEYVEA